MDSDESIEFYIEYEDGYDNEYRLYPLRKHEYGDQL